MSEAVKYKYDIKEKSIEFSICLIRYLNGLDKPRTTLPIVDQLVRSGTSIGANIHEAQTSQSNKELMRYYRIALKSANESNYWFILLDSILDNHIERDNLKEELNNLRNILGKTLIRLKEKENSIKN